MSGGGWIKLEKDLATDPRVTRMARALAERADIDLLNGQDRGGETRNGRAYAAVTLVLGGLAKIWFLADTHIDPNDVLPLGKEVIDEIVGVHGFCDAMPPDWLVVIDADHVKLPDFHIHNGTEAKKKALGQKRASRLRDREANAGALRVRPRNAISVPDLDLDLDHTSFVRFWEAYPNKVAKIRAEQAWAKLKPTKDLVEQIMAGLARARASEQWTRDDGKYIPHPASWLNGRRWTDQPPTAAGAPRSALIDFGLCPCGAKATMKVGNRPRCREHSAGLPAGVKDKQ